MRRRGNWWATGTRARMNLRCNGGRWTNDKTDGGLIIVGSLNLGGSLELLPLPEAARRQLNELPDELWTKFNIEFYSEPADAFFKALAECGHNRRNT